MEHSQAIASARPVAVSVATSLFRFRLTAFALAAATWLSAGNADAASAPYTGTPIALPGTFEAENFDKGAAGEAYRDNMKGNAGGQYRTAEDVDIIASTDSAGGGFVVNNFETGEWLNYTVNVAASGRYDVALRVSSAFGNSAFRLYIDGVDVSGAVLVPNTGSWSNFQWVTATNLQLPAGKHVLRIASAQQYFNLNQVRVTAVAKDTTAPTAPAGLTAKAASPTRVDLAWNASTDAGGVASYRVFRNGVQVGTTTTATVYADNGLTAATAYSYAVAAVDKSGNVSAKSAAVSATTAALQTPYTGTPVTVPAVIEAENFDRGGQGYAYRDNVTGNSGGQYRTDEHVDIIVSNNPASPSGYAVNNFETGEWLAYSIRVPAAGNYDIEILAANAFSANSAFHAEIDGVNVTGRVGVPLTADWVDYRWVGKKSIPLTAGNHVLKIHADQAYFNLDAVRVVATVAAPAPAPVPGTGGTPTWSCTFPSSPQDCGFYEQAKVAGRATIVSGGRDGSTAVKLTTLSGDNNVAGSGDSERNDLTLSQAATDCYQGKEQWWGHSILFPNDYVPIPTPTNGGWNWGVVFDFHNTTSGAWQANFHIDTLPDSMGGMRFRGYGGVNSGDGEFIAPIGPVVKNQWYDFVYHVKWSSGSDGFFEAWVNGVKKLNHRGPTLYAGQGCYLKLANYHTPFGTSSSVIHDRVRRGSTAASVSLTPLQGVTP